MFSVISLCQLAEVRMNQGQLRLAEAFYRKSIQSATNADGSLLPVAGQALIGLGTVLYELNDLQGAMKRFEEGIELIQLWRPFAAMEGYLGLAMCRQDLQDPGGARQAVFEARRLAEAFDSTEIDDRIVAFVDAQLQFKRGDTQAIKRYLEECKAKAATRAREGTKSARYEADELIDVRMYKYEQIALARAAIAQSHPSQALAILDSLLPFLQRNNRIRMIIEVEILRSVALQSLGDHAEALTAVERTLSLAEPGGYIRLFINEGEPVLELLRVVGSRFKVGSSTSNYIMMLMSAFIEGQAKQVDIQPSTFQPETMIEPLSDREMEVLRYLRSSLTVPEIADELYIAESTVRSHVKSIYSKLDVHRRMDAVQQAEDIGLLSTQQR
jgi:LuxR family maltose regulon positive regulatory protein